MLTQAPSTTQTFLLTDTPISWATNVSTNSIGSTGLTIGTEGVISNARFTNSTSATLAVEVQYNLIWNNSVSGATYILVNSLKYSLTQFNAYVMTNSGTFLLAPGQSFAIYNQNSSSGLILQTTSDIVITILTAGQQGPQGPTGAKSFVIDHPIKENHYLVHACLEGPEVGVYYRGKEAIINKYVTVQLPEYVNALANHFTMNVTPEMNVDEENADHSFVNIFTTPIKNNTFRIYASTPCIVHWVVFGNRKDIPLVVEVYKNDIEVKGSGPYKWI